MKSKYKTLFSFVPLVGILALMGLWAYKTTKPFDTVAYLIVGLVLLIAAISVYFKIKSYKNKQAGLTAEDEFSKRIKEKAAARAFSTSVYLWIFVILFLGDMETRYKIIIGLGILAMGLIFFINWFYLSKVGLSDENKN